MSFKIVLVLSVALAVASAVPSGAGWGAWSQGNAANPWVPVGGVNPWTPPWIASAPWFPQWSPCTTVGSSCVDCTTRQICTKIGGLQRACSDPTLPYCNLGECSATPSAECQPPAAPVENV